MEVDGVIETNYELNRYMNKFNYIKVKKKTFQKTVKIGTEFGLNYSQMIFLKIYLLDCLVFQQWR